jgi:hypothetical protein
MCSGRSFRVQNEVGNGVQSVYYSCMLVPQLWTINKKLRKEASLAWARKHSARLLISIRPSAEDISSSAPPSSYVSAATISIQVVIRTTSVRHEWERSTPICYKVRLNAILAWSLEDLLSPHRFTQVELQIFLSHWMHTEDILDSLSKVMEGHTDTDWKPIQIIPLDRWEARSRVTVWFRQSNDTFDPVSGVISILVPKARI